MAHTAPSRSKHCRPKWLPIAIKEGGEHLQGVLCVVPYFGPPDSPPFKADGTMTTEGAPLLDPPLQGIDTYLKGSYSYPPARGVI